MNVFFFFSIVYIQGVLKKGDTSRISFFEKKTKI